jgi:hypothetical protein
MSRLERASDARGADVLHKDNNASGQTGHERQETRRHRGPYKRTHQEATRLNCDTVDLRFHDPHRAQALPEDQSGITPLRP